jgi:hypothetical protein
MNCEEIEMDDLAYLLRQLCRRNRDGSHATQGDRLRSLTLMTRELVEEGFRTMRPTSLRRRHVDALLGRWRRAGLSVGTIKNRLAHLRWWAEKVGRQGEKSPATQRWVFPCGVS